MVKRLRTIPKLYLCLIFFSVLSLLLFFLQLYITNTVNREGVEKIAELQKESNQYREQVERLEIDIATYSASQRVEDRARELGFERRDNVEFIR